MCMLHMCYVCFLQKFLGAHQTVIVHLWFEDAPDGDFVGARRDDEDKQALNMFKQSKDTSCEREREKQSCDTIVASIAAIRSLSTEATSFSGGKNGPYLDQSKGKDNKRCTETK